MSVPETADQVIVRQAHVLAVLAIEPPNSPGQVVRLNDDYGDRHFLPQRLHSSVTCLDSNRIELHAAIGRIRLRVHQGNSVFERQHVFEFTGDRQAACGSKPAADAGVRPASSEIGKRGPATCRIRLRCLWLPRIARSKFWPGPRNLFSSGDERERRGIIVTREGDRHAPDELGQASFDDENVGRQQRNSLPHLLPL